MVTPMEEWWWGHFENMYGRRNGIQNKEREKKEECKGLRNELFLIIFFS